MTLKVYDTDPPVNQSLHSAIYKGEFKGELVAVKRLKSGRLDVVEREIRQLRGLEHTNLVHYKAVLRNRDATLDVVMELCELESLAVALDEYNHSFHWKLSTIGQVAAGLRYLHANNIVHKDLNPRNVLFRDLQHCRLLITNYSASVKLNSPPKPREDQIFSPPEKLITKQSDIFSLTAISCSVLVHNFPRTSKALKENIIAALRQGEITNNNLRWTLLYKGVSRKPADRPQALQFEEAFRVELPSHSTTFVHRKSYTEDCFHFVILSLTIMVIFLVSSNFRFMEWLTSARNSSHVEAEL